MAKEIWGFLVGPEIYIFGAFQGSYLDTSIQFSLISLVLVYAGISTIFANFRTFIRLYLIIFHHYIAPLHCTPIAMSQLYVTSLPHNPMSQLYVALLCRTYVTSLPPRSITSSLPCVTPHDKSGDWTIWGWKVNYSIECTWLCNKSRPFPKFLWHSLQRFFDPSRSRSLY
jgi:hypothetical protein